MERVNDEHQQLDVQNKNDNVQTYFNGDSEQELTANGFLKSKEENKIRMTSDTKPDLRQKALLKNGNRFQ